jgi:hypothetical protein
LYIVLSSYPLFRNYLTEFRLGTHEPTGQSSNSYCGILIEAKRSIWLCLKSLSLSAVRPSVLLSACNNTSHIRTDLHEHFKWAFSPKFVDEVQFLNKSDRITDNSREDACTFMCSLVSNYTMFMLVSMVINANFTFCIMDIKVTKVSTDFMVTIVTFFTEGCKVSQSLWLRERGINV